MNRILAILAAALLIVLSCSSGTTVPGSDIRSALPEKSNTLADAWPGAQQHLFAAGRPVQCGTYTAVHRIAGSGIVTIDVRSHDFDPIAALVRSDGNLIAFSDNWKQTTGARLVVRDIPPGARLLVFSPDDSRGLYDVLVREGSESDLEAFMSTEDLSDGSVTGWIDPDGYDSYMDMILREELQNDLYISNFHQARLYPFTLDTDEFVSLLLESEDFDAYLVLLSVDVDNYSFIEYCDDYYGSNSRILRELEAGDYIALIMPYSAGSGGRFTLALEGLDEGALDPIETDAAEPGVRHSAQITEEQNLAIGWWPSIMDDWQAPGFLAPFTPVAGFVFHIENTSVYEVSAYSSMDICLTLLRRTEDGSLEYVASNDDYPDLGSDSRLVEPLFPGEYIGLVSPYGGSGTGEVEFSWEESGVDVPVLRPGRPIAQLSSIETESHLFGLDLEEGSAYTITVESIEIDPMITLILADGQRMNDDDGGEGTNSLLSISPQTEQAGSCFLLVEKYSGGEGTLTVNLDQISR